MNKINTIIYPYGSLKLLARSEVQNLTSLNGDLYQLFRKCALAILHIGVDDNPYNVIAEFSDFEIKIHQQNRGVALELINAPTSAFVNGEIIGSTREMLFSALRDIVYNQAELEHKHTDLSTSKGITNYLFYLLRNADALRFGEYPNLAVCWGGHAVNSAEYKYAKSVGHELGLRKLNICTGCGAGIMKAPMKGAAIAHVKQNISKPRYLGLTEPGIITAEAPNPIVNELIILPDIEKRLEAFVRLGHGIIIFPGGVGTVEELLYVLGILTNAENSQIPYPLVLTAPKTSAKYIQQLHEFIGITLGAKVQSCYQIVIEDATKVAQIIADGIDNVMSFRRKINDAFYFNWQLNILHNLQIPFIANHQNMANLPLSYDLPTHELCANLRKVFSGIVSGNVKEQGIELIERFGPYQIYADKKITTAIDNLLQNFVSEGRMKLNSKSYNPCYKLHNY